MKEKRREHDVAHAERRKLMPPGLQQWSAAEQADLTPKTLSQEEASQAFGAGHWLNLDLLDKHYVGKPAAAAAEGGDSEANTIEENRKRQRRRKRT